MSVTILTSLSGWYMVAVSYWIVHQTAGFMRKRQPLTLSVMRASIAILALVQTVILVFGYADMDLVEEGHLALNMAFNVVLTSTIIFHKNKFNQL